MYSILRALASYLALAAPIVMTQRFNSRQSGNDTAPTAAIASGFLRGKATQLPDLDVTVNQFLGIPFAQPPVRDLRFAPPQEPSSWEEAYAASEQPNACIQWIGPPGPATDMRVKLFNDPPPPGESEDCLYLNVYVPEGGERDKAVLFWIYGGSGIAGAASLPLYDGTRFAANNDIIVVAANYRLNVFGSPKAPGIPLGEQNLGLLDQRLALNWTQQNIAAFGGDPGKVTIMGESSGAMGVGYLINTYPEDPPFRAGIEMSGSSVYSIPSLEGGAVDDDWTKLIELLNCTAPSEGGQLECARAVDADTLIDILERNNLKFTDSIKNNVTVLERPDVAWAVGNVAKVPIMIGSTADDASYFVMTMLMGAASAPSNTSATSDVSIDTILESLGDLDPETAKLIATMYASGSRFTEGANTTQGIVSRIGTDYTFRCTSGFVANLTSTLLDVPVWQYVFDAQVPSNTWEEYPDLGVYHASEIPLVFGNYPRENSTEVEAKLSHSMQKQFADFVKDPEKGPGWAQWPQVGILGVSETDAVTITKDVRELDAVCQQYNVFYLSTLPALSRMSSGDFSNNSRSNSTNPEETSAASHTAISAVVVGASLLVLAAML